MIANPVIAIHGVPRSGTSWLGEIFKSSPSVAYRYQPLFSYAFKDRLGPDSTAEAIGAFYRDLWSTTDPFVLQRDPGFHPDRVEGSPVEKATVMVYKEVRYHHILENLLRRSLDTRLVGIVRDPRAVIDSWHRAPREFDPSWDLNSEWRFADSKNKGRPEEFYGFHRWKESTRIMLSLRAQWPDRVDIVRYVDLNEDPIGTSKQLFERCGLAWSDRTERFIEESRSKDGQGAYSVFRKARPDNAWQEHLPEAITSAIEGDLVGTDLAQFLVS